MATVGSTSESEIQQCREFVAGLLGNFEQYRGQGEEATQQFLAHLWGGYLAILKRTPEDDRAFLDFYRVHQCLSASNAVLADVIGRVRSHHERVLKADPASAHACVRIAQTERVLQGLDSDVGMDWVRKAIAIDSQFSAARVELGMSYQRQEKLAEALREFDHAVFLDPANADAYIARALLFHAMDPEFYSSEFRVGARMCCELDPNHVQASSVAKYTEGRTSFLDECHEVIRELVAGFGDRLRQGEQAQIDGYARLFAMHLGILGALPHSDTALRDLYRVRGLFHTAPKKLPGVMARVRSHYEGVLAEAPDTADAWVRIAWVERILHQGQDKEAGADCIRRALNMDPDCPDAHVGLTWACKQHGEKASEEALVTALAAVDIALSLDPDSADARAEKGYLLWMTDGDISPRSLQEFERCVEKEPLHLPAVIALKTHEHTSKKPSWWRRLLRLTG